MTRPIRIGPRALLGAIDSPVAIGPRALRSAMDSSVAIGPRALRGAIDSSVTIRPRPLPSAIDLPVNIGPRALRRAMDWPIPIGPRAVPSTTDSPVSTILQHEYVHMDEVLIFRDFRSFPPTFIRQEPAPMNESFYVQDFRPNLRTSRHTEYVRTNNSTIFGHFRPTIVGRDGGGGTCSTSRQVTNLKEVRIEKEENDCSICLEVMCYGHIAGQLPCTHVFHKDCIGRWLKDSTSCPLCRAPAVINASVTASINI